MPAKHKDFSKTTQQKATICTLDEKNNASAGEAHMIIEAHMNGERCTEFGNLAQQMSLSRLMASWLYVYYSVP
jgi:hypothetical protein